MKEKNIFEDFTTLRWVKWTTRKPDFSGSVFMCFNGKNQGIGHVNNRELLLLDGLDKSEFEEYEDTFYWLEEIIDIESFRKWRNEFYKDDGIYDKFTKDFENWNNSFNCNECGCDGISDFDYDRTVSNGEVWICKKCKTEIIVGHKPNEDNY